MHFKFDLCANHFHDGCQREPKAKYQNKEMCLECYAREVYLDLTFVIKHGKYAKTFQKIGKPAFK